jgi:single-stranded-DNA-specific exonuclease
METRWRIADNIDKEKLDYISKEAGVSRSIAAILYNRGIRTIEEIDQFLNPRLKNLNSPRLMKDMDEGTNIILNAIKEGKKIVIYGDYDCDGVTSTTIMYKGLLRCGADVSYHIPDRVDEGYGMNSDTVRKLSEEGYEVILTCDNGISCVDQVKVARDLGMEVVITDHHEVPFKVNEDGIREDILPSAGAVINPKRSDCSYPFKSLCGAGVAFKFVHTLYYKAQIDSKELFDLMEIAAIGTICDVVDLTGENRIIASQGLKMLNSTKNIGLKALIKEIGYEGKKIKAGNVGFQIGPCINATGRLDTAKLSVELLLTEDRRHAEELAKELRRLNQMRQALTDSALEEIMEKIETSSIKDDRVLVVYKEDLHESLAGIIAGRIRERYNKPAYVITRAKDKAKGSGRSIEEYNMFEELSKCMDILLGAGGHPMAAGFSLEEKNIPEFRNMLNELCSLTDNDLVMKIDVDTALSMNDINLDLAEALEKLEPFGKSNREPVFMAQDLAVERIYLMGRSSEHIKIVCRDKKSSISIPAISFNGAALFKEAVEEIYGSDEADGVIENPQGVNLRMDLLFKPSVNEWNNSRSVQMMVVDYKILE